MSIERNAISLWTPFGRSGNRQDPFHSNSFHSSEASSTDYADYTEGKGAEGGRRKAEGGRQKAEGGRQKAGGRKQKAGGRKQKAGGRRQKAEGGRQKAGGRKQKAGGRRRADTWSRK
jgi:hypothetical protein